ncbi:BlaI/MecI/CopY family transcriptional regulator [Microbacterium horticulturae]|uniref:BlaI/MecI/CopY family transcriptional regulator n=1 Tax=Microbacterium horticulturae TaxID=3028316 RepID=A0ABY8BYW5_9MICO|nr:BlaI/MecI/CopY family transcriptional regulator [Microbacterium sp. KACC 23027]WEG08657.1 BlaI/MecI/CopY family transcriptional regulator [Microbacterium sp. KACC 23027]
MAGVRTRQRGELEAAVLAVLRRSDAPLSANEVRERLEGDTPAGTTVLTALDRLYEKGHVVRLQQSPRRVRFAAAQSEAESASAAMLLALEQNEDRRAVLLKFAGDLDQGDAELLRAALRPGKRERKP